MKQILIKALAVYAVLACMGCSTAQRPNNYGGALPELMRNGVPQLVHAESPYDRVSHTCTSTPIFDLNGAYAYTDVRCH